MASNSHGRPKSGVGLFGRASRGHIATIKMKIWLALYFLLSIVAFAESSTGRKQLGDDFDDETTSAPVKIFVISVLDDPVGQARLARLRSSLSSVAFEVVPAVDVRKTPERELRDIRRRVDGRRFEEINRRRVSLAEVGCSLSHLRAYETMLESNHGAALFLEDDAIPINGALDDFTAWYKTLPKDWAVVRLDDRARFWACHSPGAGEACENALKPVIVDPSSPRAHARSFSYVNDTSVSQIYGAYAYLASREAVEHWLWHAYPVAVTSDRLIQRTPPGKKQLLVHPPPFGHDDKLKDEDSMMWDRSMTFSSGEDGKVDNLAGRHLICGVDGKTSAGGTFKFSVSSSDDVIEKVMAFGREHGIQESDLEGELLRKVAPCLRANRRQSTDELAGGDRAAHLAGEVVAQR